MVHFTGSASSAGSAFQTSFAASPDGSQFANLTAPSVPANLAGLIQSIQGPISLSGVIAAPYPASKVKDSCRQGNQPQKGYMFYRGQVSVVRCCPQ
jgi:hypothetical protein